MISPLRFSSTCLAGSVAIIALANLVAAQGSVIVKTWADDSLWKTSLVRRGQGNFICMVTALGRYPHAFGVMVMEMPGKLLFAVDDRTEGLHYLPDMTVTVDGKPVDTYPTFNDPPMTSTAPDESAKVKALIERMADGKTLTVEARNTHYSMSLEGFGKATGDLASCRSEMAKLAGTTGTTR